MNFSPLSVSPVGEMLVSIVNEKTIDSQVATSYNKTVKGTCPSPTGEVRWGLEVCDLGISGQITQPMNISPLSVSPVG